MLYRSFKMTSFAMAALVVASAAIGYCQSPLAGLESNRVFPLDLNQQNLNNGVLTINSAKLACVHKVQIAAQADGLIQNLLSDEGDVVKKGDTLLQIDGRVAAAELEVAEKELLAAERQAQQTAEVEYAKKSSAFADKEYEAANDLLAKGSSTLSETLRKRLEAERARLGIDVAVVKHENEGLAAEVAKAKLDASKVRLELYNVVAPYDGVIVERLRDEGEWIRAGEPILRLTHMDEMKVQVSVDVRYVAPWQLEGAPMKVIVPVNARQDLTLDTVVSYVSTEITSDRVTVTAKIPNNKVGESWLMRDGATATVQISINGN